MPPMFSRPRADCLGLPLDTWSVILPLLAVSEKRALMLTCKAVHNVVAPNMYRTLAIHEWLRLRPLRVKRKCSCCLPHLLMGSVLPCLLHSICNDTGGALCRRYMQYIKSLTIISYVPLLNLHTIPILVQVLRHMTALQYLQIELCGDSVHLLLALLFHSNLIRTPTLLNTVDTSMISYPHTILHLPVLKWFRMNHYEVAVSMLRLRPLEALVVDGAMIPACFPRLLQEGTDGGSSLTSRSLALARPVDFHKAAVQTTMLTFPNLEYLSFRLDPEYLVQSMMVSSLISTSRSIRC